MACVRRWTACKLGVKCTAKTWYKLRPENRSRGAGTDEHIDPSTLLAPNLTVIMSSDVKVAGRSGKRIERQVIMLIDQGQLKFADYQPVLPSLWKELAGDFGRYPTGVDIYTDGAWDKKTGTIKDVFQYGDGREIVGSVGIVITLTGDNWKEYGVRTITINEGALLALKSVFQW